MFSVSVSIFVSSYCSHAALYPALDYKPQTLGTKIHLVTPILPTYCLNDLMYNGPRIKGV